MHEHQVDFKQKWAKWVNPNQKLSRDPFVFFEVILDSEKDHNGFSCYTDVNRIMVPDKQLRLIRKGKPWRTKWETTEPAFLRTVSVPAENSTVILANRKIHGKWQSHLPLPKKTQQQNQTKKKYPKNPNPHLLTLYTYFNPFFSRSQQLRLFNTVKKQLCTNNLEISL